MAKKKITVLAEELLSDFYRKRAGNCIIPNL